MKRWNLLLSILFVCLLTGCGCEHEWLPPDCSHPRFCTVCKETDGEPLGHSWNDATCTAPKTCAVCGTSEGTVLAHNWTDATCAAPKTCSACGATEGTSLAHNWLEATCTTADTCTKCGLVQGEPLGHTEGAWAVDPETPEGHTVIAHKYCSVCNELLDTKEFSSDLLNTGSPAISSDKFTFTPSTFISDLKEALRSDFQVMRAENQDDQSVHYILASKNGIIGYLILFDPEYVQLGNTQYSSPLIGHIVFTPEMSTFNHSTQDDIRTLFKAISLICDPEIYETDAQFILATLESDAALSPNDDAFFITRGIEYNLAVGEKFGFSFLIGVYQN